MGKTCIVQHQVYEGQCIQLCMLMTVQFWIASSVNFIILLHQVLKKYYLSNRSSECVCFQNWHFCTTTQRLPLNKALPDLEGELILKIAPSYCCLRNPYLHYTMLKFDLQYLGIVKSTFGATYLILFKLINHGFG